jgi:hypothetical protein
MGKEGDPGQAGVVNRRAQASNPAWDFFLIEILSALLVCYCSDGFVGLDVSFCTRRSISH